MSTQHAARNGRKIAVHRLSDGARTVVFCHPAPGSGSFDPDPEQTARRDVELIGVDRPGYGTSEPLPADAWMDVGVAADDVAHVLDESHAGPVGVAGWSAGGRVALALAARRPDLVDRVVVLATPAPDEEVPWMPDEHRQGMDAMRDLPASQVHAALSEMLGELAMADPFSDEGLAMLAGSPDEVGMLRGDERRRIAEMLSSAFTRGAAGLAADIAGYCLRPWGFEPEQVKAKTLLLYGSRDPMTGNRHARWWHQRLPSSRVEMVPDAGHLIATRMWKRALSHLAPGALR